MDSLLPSLVPTDVLDSSMMRKDTPIDLPSTCPPSSPHATIRDIVQSAPNNQSTDVQGDEAGNTVPGTVPPFQDTFDRVVAMQCDDHAVYQIRSPFDTFQVKDVCELIQVDSATGELVRGELCQIMINGMMRKLALIAMVNHKADSRKVLGATSTLTLALRAMQDENPSGGTAFWLASITQKFPSTVTPNEGFRAVTLEKTDEDCMTDSSGKLKATSQREEEAIGSFCHTTVPPLKVMDVDDTLPSDGVQLEDDLFPSSLENVPVTPQEEEDVDRDTTPSSPPRTKNSQRRTTSITAHWKATSDCSQEEMLRDVHAFLNDHGDKLVKDGSSVKRFCENTLSVAKHLATHTKVMMDNLSKESKQNFKSMSVDMNYLSQAIGQLQNCFKEIHPHAAEVMDSSQQAESVAKAVNEVERCKQWFTAETTRNRWLRKLNAQVTPKEEEILHKVPVNSVEEIQNMVLHEPSKRYFIRCVNLCETECLTTATRKIINVLLGSQNPLGRILFFESPNNRSKNETYPTVFHDLVLSMLKNWYHRDEKYITKQMRRMVYNIRGHTKAKNKHQHEAEEGEGDDDDGERDEPYHHTTRKRQRVVKNVKASTPNNSAAPSVNLTDTTIAVQEEAQSVKSTSSTATIATKAAMKRYY